MARNGVIHIINNVILHGLEKDLSKELKDPKEQRLGTTLQPKSKITTPGSCDPYGSKCRTVFVSADMPEMVKDYADIKGRYIYNQDEKVEWAPQRPVYEKVSRSRSLIYER